MPEVFGAMSSGLLARPELAALSAVLLLGLVQALAPAGPRLEAASRNFERTFMLFAAAVAVLAALGRFGHWSANGALAYAAGRFLYLPACFLAGGALRRFPWALSMAGIIGCVAEVIRATVDAAA